MQSGRKSGGEAVKIFNVRKMTQPGQPDDINVAIAGFYLVTKFVIPAQLPLNAGANIGCAGRGSVPCTQYHGNRHTEMVKLFNHRLGKNHIVSECTYLRQLRLVRAVDPALQECSVTGEFIIPFSVVIMFLLIADYHIRCFIQFVFHHLAGICVTLIQQIVFQDFLIYFYSKKISLLKTKLILLTMPHIIE